MINRICPAGYADPTTKELVESLMTNEHESWIVVDIRRSPFAAPFYGQWNGSALAKKYPGRYIHVPELGNLNHKKEDRHKGIQLADPEAGLKILQKELEKGHNLILLCGCKYYEKCHRRPVAEAILERFPEVKVI